MLRNLLLESSPSHIRLPLPFSRQTPPNKFANLLTAEKRSLCISSVEQLSKVAASPGWGVNIQLDLFSEAPVAIRSANKFKPSASTMSGVPRAFCTLKACWNKCRDHLFVPSPGPIAMVVAFSRSTPGSLFSSSVPHTISSGCRAKKAGL